MVGYTPEGPTAFRNPPPTHFTPPTEKDLPLFAHDGRGKTLPGEWTNGKHGELLYNTKMGAFQHGIDALASHMGEFLGRHGINRSPVEVINQAIKQFNGTHTKGKDHQLPMFDNMTWRKIRAGVLPPGKGTREEAIRPTRTHNGTLITAYTNKNYEKTPMGRFIESYSIPFHEQLQHVLEDQHGMSPEMWKSLPFVKYPYMYAHYTVPNVTDENGNVRSYIRSQHKEHPGQVTSDMMSNAPEGYFPDTANVHTWESLHHLPDAFFYPKLNKAGNKPGKVPTKLYQAAHAMIDQAISNGTEHIPDINITYNQSGKMSTPDMVQRPLREVLQTPDMREALIKDIAHVPAMMFLFGRSFQGDFKNLYNHMMEKYGAQEDSLSHEDHMRFFQPGEKGGQGMHSTAGKIMALARASGQGSSEEKSKFGEHQITSDELEAMEVPFSEGAMGHVDRFRGILEALADHQAGARGHNVRMAIGDIPTEPMQNIDIHGYPQEGADVSLDPHMDGYLHGIEDYAGSDGMPIPPQPEVLPEGGMSATPSPTLNVAPQPPVSLPPGRTPPVAVSQAPRQLPAQFQEQRPSIATMNPDTFRQFIGRQTPAPTPELTPLEERAQTALADPRQQLLTQYMKAEDSHLPIMDRTLKALERMQKHEAILDTTINHGNVFPEVEYLAKHVGLTSGEVNSINETMGDWHKIAKAYNVKPKVVKVIKLNMR